MDREMRQTTIRFTDFEWEQIEFLQEELDETCAGVLRKALNYYHELIVSRK
jgi:hypothetical protein